MENKKSIGVIVFSWIYLISAVSCILAALISFAIISLPQEHKIEVLKNPTTQQLGINSIAEIDKYYQSKIKQTLPLGIITLIATIGLFRLKRWSLTGIILVAIWGILDQAFKILGKNTVHYPLSVGYNISVIFGLLLYILTIYFFTRPKVREQFR
ncbi:MAG: hypothetical protein NTU54_05515 [Candidatus Omnitrophica bacterium]|nr:hypothetical protein [Candidatus Omnitrophota bacterium]